MIKEKGKKEWMWNSQLIYWKRGKRKNIKKTNNQVVEKTKFFKKKKYKKRKEKNAYSVATLLMKYTTKFTIEKRN